MEVVATICSKEKLTDTKPLPANERYLGSHITFVKQVAEKRRLPFFIVSGVYGLISANEKIPYYDHLLIKSEVEALAEKIATQLKERGISVIHLYSKEKPNWKVYEEALMGGAKLTGAEVETQMLAAS